MATLAAEAQAFVVGAVTQDTNVLTAAIVPATRVHHCKTRQMWSFHDSTFFSLMQLWMRPRERGVIKLKKKRCFLNVQWFQVRFLTNRLQDRG